VTSLAPPTLVWFYRQWETLADYPSATFSGIVPDQAHLDRGGYHCSIEDLIRFGNGGDYSNTRPLDKAPPVTKPNGVKQSAAVDVSLSRADMVKLYGRVKRVFDDRTDPRRKWLNYWNAWNGVAGNLPDRFNFQSNTIGTTDRSHEWHSHDDHPRLYVDLAASEADCWTAMRAALSVVKGETKEQWLASEGDDMALTESEHYIQHVINWRVAGIIVMADPVTSPAWQGPTKLWPATSTPNLLARAILAGGDGGALTPADLLAVAAAAEAGAEKGVADAVPGIEAEVRDAVADLGEGGATQVRADT